MVEPVAVDEVEVVDDSKPYSGEKSSLSRDSSVALDDNSGSWMKNDHCLGIVQLLVVVTTTVSYQKRMVQYPPVFLALRTS